MKTALLSLSFLLFALTTNVLLSFSRRADEHVLDYVHKPIAIIPGRRYIIRTVWFPIGGGVAPQITLNLSSCPVTILQNPSEIFQGEPVKFTVARASPGPGTIFTGTPALDISFVSKADCAESSKWVVIEDDYPMRWIGIGGYKDHPGKKTVSGTFNIQRWSDRWYDEEKYKLVFCPTSPVSLASSSSPSPNDVCFDVGIDENDYDNGRRLVLITAKPSIGTLRHWAIWLQLLPNATGCST